VQLTVFRQAWLPVHATTHAAALQVTADAQL